MPAVDAEMLRALEWAYQCIKTIQETARSGAQQQPLARWPMIVMRTIKGWTGIHDLHGKPIEGPWRSHQVCIVD